VEIKERDKTTHAIPQQQTQNLPQQLADRPQPADQHQTDDPPAKLLTDLMKIYNNDDKKYGGEEYDILSVALCGSSSRNK
jgi:hypothetical protein